MSKTEMRGHACPVCGWDGSRDFQRYPSLTRLRPEGGLLSQEKMIAVSEREWEALQQELKQLRQGLAQFQGTPRVLMAPPPDPTLWEPARSASFKSIRPKQDAVLPECLTVPAIWAGQPVERLAYAAFQGRNVRQVFLPGGLLEVGEYAFSSCVNLQEITLPSKVRLLGKYSFSRCIDLTWITFSPELKRIDDYAFYYCVKLKAADLPEGLEEVGESAFSSCVELEQMTLPSTLRRIGRAAFYGCKNLEKVVLRGPVEVLEEGIFLFCKSLQRVVIPRSWTDGRERLSKLLPPSVQIESE